MTRKILRCGIVKQELEYLLQDQDAEIQYLDPALHVDFGKLKEALNTNMDNIDSGDFLLVMGTQCHPDGPQRW